MKKGLIFLILTAFAAPPLYALVNIDQAWLNANGPSPYSLDQAGETYELATDVTTGGSAIGVIAANVTLLLNGHTITYNNTPRINIPNASFENGNGAIASDWDFSNAPSAERFAGDFLKKEIWEGTYSVKFSGGDEYIESNNSITLDPNTKYYFTAKFLRNGVGEGYVQLVQNNTVVYEVMWDQPNWRSMQMKEVEINTGSSPEVYKVRLGVRNGNFTSSPFYIDDLKMTQFGIMGIVVGPQSWTSRHWDFTRFGRGDNFRVVGPGNLIQGPGHSFRGWGIYQLRGDSLVVDGINVTVNGDETHAIYANSSSGTGATIANNTLKHMGFPAATRNRDQGWGAIVYGGYLIENNNVLGGFIHGIRSASGIIRNNTVRITSWFSNAFGITEGAEISGNTVDFFGTFETGYEYGGRGIRGGNGSQISNNTIKAIERRRNQEYGGIALGGTYGIQLEGVNNGVAYNNFIEVHSLDGGESYALRLGGSGPPVTGWNIYDNVFRAYSDGIQHSPQIGSWAHCFKFEALDYAGNNFYDNECRTNDAIVLSQELAFTEHKNLRITLEPPLRTWGAAGAYPFAHGYDSVNQGLYAEQRFIDPVGDLAYLDDDHRRERRYRLLIEPRGAHQVMWTTTIQVEEINGDPISNANVSIEDQFGNVVFTGQTDSSGQAVTVLSQYRTQGDQKTSYSPYTATANDSTRVADRVFTADQTQTIVIVLTNGPNPGRFVLSSPNNPYSEADGIVDITVSRLFGTQGAVTVDYATTDGSATDGQDYTGVSGTLAWGDGESDDKVISIPIIDDSIESEGDEDFTLDLNNPTGGASLGNPNSITIIIQDNDNPSNNPPTADDQSVSTDEDVGVDIVLTGSDPDGDPLTFFIISQPSNGTLSGSGANRTYIPNVDFNGTDSFTFRVNDGTTNSNAATVDITVNPINDKPIADNQNVTTQISQSVAITLIGSDVDGDSLSYFVQTLPQNGTLKGTGSNRFYTPDAGYVGNDSFTFLVNDGTLNSDTATVRITVASGGGGGGGDGNDGDGDGDGDDGNRFAPPNFNKSINIIDRKKGIHEMVLNLKSPSGENLDLKIYNRNGEQVHDGIIPTGSNSTRWTGINSDGSKVSSGLYFIRAFKGNKLIESWKAIIVN